MPRRWFDFTPAQALAASIGGLVAAGTILLALPFASTGERLSWIDALFTATSAVCVTGLIVVDTPRDLSVAGQSIVMLLIQAGGLGYMTITTVVATALGKRLSLGERLTLQEALNLQSGEGLVQFTLSVLRLTLVFELAGAAVLALWWWQDMGAGRAAYFGLFHSISAFNNAGFALFSDSLIGFRADPVVNLVISILFVCGGLGFVVLHSSTGDEQTSRIVSKLWPGAPVTTMKNTVDHVVTEFGVAELRGQPVSVRARRLIAIAHPRFRDELEREAREAGYLRG